jgi:hypothetical protein
MFEIKRDLKRPISRTTRRVPPPWSLKRPISRTIRRVPP